MSSFGWTINKFFSTHINNSNTISGTYSNVSLRVDGNSQLSNTTITALGVNKNAGTTYALDVGGNVYGNNYYMDASASITASNQLVSKSYVDSNTFSTANKSQLTNLLTLATGATSPYVWAYNSAQYIIFTGTATQVFQLPVVSAANLGCSIVIFRTGGGTFTINPATGYSLYDFNNAVLTTRPLDSNDRWISLIAVSTGTTQWQMTSQFPNQLITATLSSTQTFSGLKTFSLAPVMSGASITSATIPTSALVGSFVDTNTTQSISGAKTFSGASTFNNSVGINGIVAINSPDIFFYYPSIPTSGSVRHDFTVNTYTNTMLNCTFTKNVGIQNGNIDNLTVVNISNFNGPTNTFQNSLIANNLLPYFSLNIQSLKMGFNSMQYATASSGYNIAFGTNTIQGDSITTANNTASKNVVIGYNAGAGLTKNSSISPDDNVIIGYQAGKNLSQAGYAYAGPSYSNVIIGSNAGQNGWIQKSVIIGANVASAGSAFLSDSTIVGYNSGVSLSDKSGISIFGASNLPVYNGNGGQAFGCQLGTNALNNDQGLFCGINSGANINTGWGCCFLGGQVGNGISTGGGCFFGGIAVDTTKADLTNSVAIGSFFNVDDDDTFKIGGYNIITGAYQSLLIGNKNRILFNTNVASVATQALTFEMGEHINIYTSTTTNIDLPVPATQNIGARFTIVKSYSSAPVAITITASTGLTIYSSAGNTNTYAFSSSEYYLTLICINTSGTAWIITNQDTSKKYVDLTTSQSIQGIKTFQDTTGSPTVTSTRIETINDSVSNNPNLNFLHTKTSVAVPNDTCGIITFDMKNSTSGVTTRYGNMNCYVSSGTSGAESSVIAITGKQAGADASYLNLGGGISAFSYPLRVTNYWPSTAFNTLISSATTLSYTASNSFYKYYSISAGATAFTITLPTIDASHLGNEIQFRRVGGTTTTVVSFIGNGTQNVYNQTNVGGTTAQALMASGGYIVRLVPMLLTNAPTYAWFQL